TQESVYTFPDLDSSAPVEAEIKEWNPHPEEPSSELLYQESMTSVPPSMLGKVDILELNPSLDVFALASIEITKSVQKSGQAAKPDPDSQAWDQFRKEVVTSIQAKLVALNAVIESVHHHILFIAFPKEASTEASALKAVKTALAIVSEVHHFHSQPIKIRVGIDLEHANLRNPIVSTTERTIAKPGGIVVSEAIYPYVEDQFDFDTVGPLKVGNQMLTFYQVLSSIPDNFHELAPVSHTPEPGQPSRPIAEYIPLEPVSEQITSVGEIYHSDVSPQETIPLVKPVKVDHPIASLNEPLVQEEEPVLDTFKPLDIYRPPIFGMIHTPRQPAYTYEAGYQALQDEIKFFLTNPTMTSGQDSPSGNGKVLSVSASRGLGKTYILDAIHMQISQSELGQHVFWLASKNYRFLQDSQLPLSLWLDWLQVSFGLGMEGNNAEDAKNTILQSLNFLYGGAVPEDVSDFFLDFLSVGALTPISMMSQSNIGRIEHYISGFLQILQSQKPVVMVIEDLQYADAASLDLLVRLLNRGVLELNVCFVISHPRDFYADGPLAEAFQKYPYKEFVIGNLTESESYAFLQEGPLQGTYDTFPPGLIQQIVSKSNGLPIYLLEVLRYLHLQGVLRIQQIVLGNNTPVEKLVLNEQYAKTVEAMILPNSVDDIIWQRLHHLSKSAFFTVQMASVIGEKFSLGVLQDLCGTPNESEFQQILKELFDQSWIVPDVVNTGRFTNGMCWDKAYESIEPQARQQYHRLVSEYLMEGNNANPRFAVHPGQIAHHSEKGGLINRSFQFWNLVGVHCAQLGSISGLNRGLFKALSLLKESQLENPVEIEIQIRENLGFLNIQEDPELALNLLQSVYQFAQSQQNFSKQVQLLGLLANCHEGVGEYHEAQIYLEKALQLIEKDQYPLEYASFLTTRLEGLFNLGKLQKGLDIIENELEPLFKHPHFSAQNLQSDPIYLNGYFSSQLIKAKIFVCQCNDKAFEVIDQMLESLHPEQFPEMFLSFHLVRCQGYLRKGQYEKCQNTLQSLMGDIQSIGSPPRLMAQWGLLAIIFYIELGNYETAQSYLDNTLEQAELAKDYLTYLMTANHSAYLAYKQNQFDEAKDTLEKTITDSCEYRFASAALMGWRFMAELDLAQGHVEEALKFSTQALEIANRSEMRNLSEVFYLTTLRSACLMGTNQSKEAGVILQEMWPTVSQTGFLPVMAEFASTIGLLYKNLASKVPTQEQSQKNSQRANEFFQKSMALWNQTGNQFQMQRVSGFVN
ncbi:MAG: AAA family ATPase, partial [Cyanobacteria bacterium]|nr:AAA family ATPase [Cyanobacteriota bacterium]